MQPIKNIIFDLGGVLLNIDFARTQKAFEALGIIQFASMFNQRHADQLFKKLETGQIAPKDFYAAFRQATNSNLTDEQIAGAWNALLIDFPKERLDWLKTIRKKYNIYLFSNTNSIHYDYFTELFQKTTGGHFDDCFIKAYYSQNLGLRKPDVASYLKIIEEQQLNPAETLFIDDTAQNITGARKAGLQAIHLTGGLTVLDLGL